MPDENLNTTLWWIAPIGATLAILFAVVFFTAILRASRKQNGGVDASDKKQPLQFHAWGMSLNACFLLVSFVMLTSTRQNIAYSLVSGCCAISMVLFAIAAWKSYFEKLLDYKLGIEQNSNKNSEQEPSQPLTEL